MIYFILKDVEWDQLFSFYEAYTKYNEKLYFYMGFFLVFFSNQNAEYFFALFINLLYCQLHDHYVKSGTNKLKA